MKKQILLLAAVWCSMAAFATTPPATFYPEVEVRKVSGMTIENGIDHPAWKSVPSHQFLQMIGPLTAINRKPVESGSVQYLYDDNYFYVRADFVDSDIVVNATSNGGHFYNSGDVLEVFIKPEKSNYYWEIYGTANKLNTRFHYGSRSTLGLPSGFKHDEVGIKVNSKINGTLNDSSDKDHSYVVLVAIPIAELNHPIKEGHPCGTVPFSPGEEWRVFSSRYNYSRYLKKYELSSFPQIFGGYHSLEYFAKIKFVK
ncbi:MAG: hypothetical protein E7043_05140 [Lentisphaerae bacterium]|nr:hypothetical protein [Lentisphaerota bacterium]